MEMIIIYGIIIVLPTYIDYQYRGVGESVEEFVDDLKQAMKDE